MTKRLFQDDASPAGTVVRKPRCAQAFDDGRSQRRRSRYVEQDVLAGAVLLHLLDFGFQVRIELGAVGISAEIMKALREISPATCAVVARVFRLRGAFVHPVAKLVVVELRPPNAENVKLGIGAADARQVVK